MGSSARNLTPGDERRRVPGADPAWEESWSFDFTSADGAFGGYARLALVAGTGRAWFWAGVCGEGRSTVAVRDHDVELPRAAGLEVRSPGLWADLICEDPLDHWSVGLEALAVAFEDPAEAWSAERGVPTPLGFDLGWEALAPAAGRTGHGDASVDAGGYDQACRVDGEVLVGAERVAIDGWGSRGRAWGPRTWWPATGSGRAWGRLDGVTFLGRPLAPAFDGQGLPLSATVEMAGDGEQLKATTVEATTLALAPVLVPAADRAGPAGPAVDGRLVGWLCRYRAGEDRPPGVGWAWWLHGQEP